MAEYESAQSTVTEPNPFPPDSTPLVLPENIPAPIRDQIAKAEIKIVPPSITLPELKIDVENIEDENDRELAEAYDDLLMWSRTPIVIDKFESETKERDPWEKELRNLVCVDSEGRKITGEECWQNYIGHNKLRSNSVAFLQGIVSYFEAVLSDLPIDKEEARTAIDKVKEIFFERLRREKAQTNTPQYSYQDAIDLEKAVLDLATVLSTVLAPTSP